MIYFDKKYYLDRFTKARLSCQSYTGFIHTQLSEVIWHGGNHIISTWYRFGILQYIHITHSLIHSKLKKRQLQSLKRFKLRIELYCSLYQAHYESSSKAESSNRSLHNIQSAYRKRVSWPRLHPYFVAVLICRFWSYVLGRRKSRVTIIGHRFTLVWSWMMKTYIKTAAEVLKLGHIVIDLVTFKSSHLKDMYCKIFTVSYYLVGDCQISVSMQVEVTA